MSESDGIESLAAIAASGAVDAAERIAEIIRGGRGYRWVGIYRVQAREIAALGWSGAGEPAYPRFPIDRGLCGAAVATGDTVVSDDVRTDERYLTTFGTTRSEIVVPITAADGAVGALIDVESDQVAAFGPDDRAFLERCAPALAPLCED